LGAVSVAFPSKRRFLMWRYALRFSAASLCLCGALVAALALNYSGARLHVSVVKTAVSL
jgi:hypothetical protein